ncbi:uncharacterized protein BO96DRAFT_347664 [Aspergillus niger CBS 101883]|uniref:uncharacterized protein n=1 Tax=Aspergillus lacticoffeatus (strain CBS 101883) TaxID=1450533 RepID=UPI000D7FA495|nr:uncharacterized protein BO96DRAFT_347664 [Aspergillus niger CBS 101883]PYH52470.1 hypothetical protein BO96DRAFT_347664 [Aspergillus niger CBS 101883]
MTLNKSIPQLFPLLSFWPFCIVHPAPGGLRKDYPWLLRINYTGRTGRFTPVVGIAEGLYAMRLGEHELGIDSVTIAAGRTNDERSQPVSASNDTSTIDDFERLAEILVVLMVEKKATIS